MAKFNKSWLVSHTPTYLVDEVEDRKNTIIKSFKKIGQELRDARVETLVVASTHWQPEDAFCIDIDPKHFTITDYFGFGVEIEYDCDGDAELADSIVKSGQDVGLPVEAASWGVDHAVTVPLHFMLPERRCRVVPLSVSQFDFDECLQWGRTIRTVLERSQKIVAFLVSGSLSHNLSMWSAGVELPEAKILDDQIIRTLESGEGERLRSLDPHLVKKVTLEAKLRHIYLLVGFTGNKTKGKLLAYQQTQSVGDAVMEFEFDRDDKR